MKLWKRFRNSYFLYSFLRDPVAMGSFIILAMLTMTAFGAPVIAPHDPYDTTTINIMDSELPPRGWKTPTRTSSSAPTPRAETC